MKLYSVTTVNLIYKWNGTQNIFENVDTRTVGIYTEYLLAQLVIECNKCDIHERDWTYAVIEEFKPDQLYPDIIAESWFEWKGDHDSGRYEYIFNKPAELDKIVSFGIG